MLAVFAALTLASTGVLSAQITTGDLINSIVPATNAIDGAVTPRFVLPVHDQIYAGIASDVTVGLSIGMDTLHSWQSPNRKAAFTCQAIRDGAVLGISELLKLIVHRERPDMSDNMSWPSEHTMFAAASTGGPSLAFVIPITIGTGAGRIMANKHYLSDVLSGALIGSVSGHYTRFCQ